MKGIPSWDTIIERARRLSTPATTSINAAAGETADVAPEAGVDPADAVEHEQELPAPTRSSTPLLNRRSPFYLGFVGALGVLLAWGLVRVLGQLSQELTFVLIALVLALGLNPIVEQLIRLGMSRGWAVFLVFTGLVLVFALVGFLVIPPIVSQANELVAQAPHLLDNLRRDRQIRNLDARYHLIERGQAELRSRLTSDQTLSRIFGGVIGAGKAIVSGVVDAVTILVLTLYFLAALPKVKASAYRLVPLSRRARAVQLSEEVSRRVGGYVIGQAVVATINGALCFTMLELLGLPFAPIIAVTVAFLGLIPIVGTLAGGVLVVLVALFSSWQQAAVMLAYYVVYHIFDAYILSPRVMRRAVQVPPAVTILAILAGGTLLGIIGALIAIPVAAGLLLIYEQVIVPHQQRT